MANEQLITKSYLLSDREIESIMQVSKENNISASSALRIIINEWAANKADTVRVPIVGKIVKNGKVIFFNGREPE